MGWVLVAYALRMLWRNRVDVLKICVGPVIVMLVLTYLAIKLSGVTHAVLIADISRGEFSQQVAMAVGLILTILIFGLSWIAVAWHRFILLEEYPGLLPTLRGDRVAAYAGRSLLLGLLLVLLMIPILGVTEYLARGLGLTLLPGMSAVINVLQTIVMTYLWLRLAMVLPATAIGKDFRLADGWQAAAPLSGEIFRAAAIITVFDLVISLTTEVLAIEGWPLLVATGLGLWVSLMIGNAILTTLYGHLAEGRRLS